MSSNRNRLKNIVLMSLLFAFFATLAFSFYNKRVQIETDLYMKEESLHVFITEGCTEATAWPDDTVPVTMSAAAEPTGMEAVFPTEPAETTAPVMETTVSEISEAAPVPETSVSDRFLSEDDIYETTVSIQISEAASDVITQYDTQIGDLIRSRRLFSALTVVAALCALAVLCLLCLLFRRPSLQESVEVSALLLLMGAAVFITVLKYAIQRIRFWAYHPAAVLPAAFIALFIFAFGANGMISFLFAENRIDNSFVKRLGDAAARKKTGFAVRLVLPVVLAVWGPILAAICFFCPLLDPAFDLRLFFRALSLFWLFITGLMIFVCRSSLKAMERERAAAIEQAKVSERLRVDLIQNVSHDLRTPLTSILGYSELLKKEALSDEGSEELRKLNEKAGYMKDLVEALFELTKVSSGVIKSDMRELDLIRLMEQTLAFYSESLEKAGLKTVRHYAPEPLPIVSDGRFLNQILSNLLNNVVKYALPGTRVHIHTDRLEGHVSVRITNVASYEMTFDASAITERFARGDASRSTSGNGIGLAIAVTYAEAVGGSFRVETDGDQFSAVLTLPC